MKRQQFQKGMEFPEVVQVRLRGHCNADQPNGQQVRWRFGLVYMYTINGEIQPLPTWTATRLRKLWSASFAE